MNGNALLSATRKWIDGYTAAWDQFWFTPRLPHTLGLLRIVTGLMLLYSHLVLATDLSAFLGDHAWISNETSRQLHDGAFGYSDLARTYLWYFSHPAAYWLHHLLTLTVTACFAVGLMTRITAPAAWFLQLMYLHRMTGHLFGLDQIVTYSTMYLMLSPCGSCFSVDAWLRDRLAGRRENNRRLRWLLPTAEPSVAANIATRLFQLHVCVIYLFGGLSKARGETWWDGTALWYAIGNYEYQSIDMTWLAHYPRIFTALSHATLFWEVFYCLLVWPRLTRPLVLATAVAVHGGIALFLGMITFGVMMIAANMIFIRPETVLKLLGRDKSPEGDLEIDGGDDVSGRENELEETETLDAFSLEELGLAEVELDSSGSDLLSRPPQETGSTKVVGDLVQREAMLAKREERLRLANRTLGEKKERLLLQLEKYNDRVARLKKRESKIKQLVERRRNKDVD